MILKRMQLTSLEWNIEDQTLYGSHFRNMGAPFMVSPEHTYRKLDKNLNTHCYFTIFTVSDHPSFLFDLFISTQIHTLHEKYF
jgi:hypothetical protein